MKTSLFKPVFAGFTVGVTLNLVMLLTFRMLGLGWNGGGILLNPSIQSEKLISAVKKKFN